MDSPEDVLAIVRQAMTDGDLDTAESALKKAARRWPREPEFSIRYAFVLRSQGKDRAAYKAFRKVMKKAPERLDACRGAADCAILIGKAKEAEKLYGRAIGLGMSLDEASVGIARSYTLRSRHSEAWEKAVAQFSESGRKSRELHRFLSEIAPIVGSSVPQLDEFDMGDVEQRLDAVRRDQVAVDSTNSPFEAGSIEEMAGVDKGSLVTDHLTAIEDLLGIGTESEGETSLGIDLSALEEAGTGEPATVTPPEAEPSEPSSSKASTPSSTEDDDDPFADWPDI